MPPHWVVLLRAGVQRGASRLGRRGQRVVLQPHEGVLVAEEGEPLLTAHCILWCCGGDLPLT
eukprot:scaffold112162_cov45-Phaeocystis_antarctica.AAC.3